MPKCNKRLECSNKAALSQQTSWSCAIFNFFLQFVPLFRIFPLLRRMSNVSVPFARNFACNFRVLCENIHRKCRTVSRDRNEIKYAMRVPWKVSRDHRDLTTKFRIRNAVKNVVKMARDYCNTRRECIQIRLVSRVVKSVVRNNSINVPAIMCSLCNYTRVCVWRRSHRWTERRRRPGEASGNGGATVR